MNAVCCVGFAVFPLCSAGWSSLRCLGPKTISYSHCQLHMRTPAIDEDKSNVCVSLSAYFMYTVRQKNFTILFCNNFVISSCIGIVIGVHIPQ